MTVYMRLNGESVLSRITLTKKLLRGTTRCVLILLLLAPESDSVLLVSDSGLKT